MRRLIPLGLIHSLAAAALLCPFFDSFFQRIRIHVTKQRGLRFEVHNQAPGEFKGIDAGRIDVTSFGEERPVDASENEAAWAQNRRAEFEIIAGGERLVAPR